jgi:tetratricopeptide (TPR) repeat protein
MADRYMYIPMLGLFVAVVWFLADWGARLQLNQAHLALAFVIAVSPYVYVTHTQIGYWKNSYTLFTHTLQVTQNNGIAENNLGSALIEMGQPQLAEVHFESATRLIPELASAHYNLGLVLQMQNHLEEAAHEYHRVIALPSDPLQAAQAHNNLGIVYLALKNNNEAIKELNAAIALNPSEHNSYIGRGQIELQYWNFDAAIGDFSRAADIAPSPMAFFWLGRAFEGKGDYHRAAAAYTAALRLAPDMNDARTRLDVVKLEAQK